MCLSSKVVMGSSTSPCPARAWTLRDVLEESLMLMISRDPP